MALRLRLRPSPHRAHLLAAAAHRLGSTLSLAEFAASLGAGPEVQIVLDRAGWHVSRQVQVPAGLTLVFLPPYSPELQPAERLWPLSDEPLAHRALRDLDELEAIQVERCRTLQAHPACIQGPTHFHWWPQPLQPSAA